MRAKQITSALALGALLATAPLQQAQAQQSSEDQVVLIADSVYLSANNFLTAEGNVEAISGDTRLTASMLTYNAVDDVISIEGPIRITDGQSIEMVAAFAELDADLQNGLLQSAQLVLDQQVRLNADAIRRINGNTSELEQVRVVSCKVCDDGRAPLWYIRANRVRHDEEEKQLYLDHAQLRVFDIPVFYLPRLRLPDPTQTRATGFLIPSITQRSQIGTAVRVPYFIALGDHRDLRLAPYVSVNMTTVEARYRQAFRNGEIELNGAVTTDNFSGFDTRAYLFATGRFDAPRDFELTFDVKTTSDRAYLSDYDYSSLERLNSELAFERASRTENTRFSLNYFRTLRDTEDNETIPSLVYSARTENRLFPRGLGGELLWELELHGHNRISSVDTDLNADGIVDGRDVTRLNAELNWRRNWVTYQGLQFGVEGNLALDAIYADEDATITQERYFEATPTLAAHLRYPLLRHDADGVTHVLEPIAQIAWSGGSLRSGTPAAVANDESTRVEFDEGNLLSLSRFASDDRRERGLSAAIGLNYARYGTDWTTYLSFGQVFREEEIADFSSSSGLNGEVSDMLLAGQFAHHSGLSFASRVLIDGVNGLNKAEAVGTWKNQRIGVDASYVWLDADPQEDRADVIAQWNLDTQYRFSRHWTALANWRYDVASRSTSEAGLGFEYRNECVKAQFSVSRRFTSSTTVDPVTDWSFTVELLGFSTRTRDKSYTKQCSTTAG